MSLKKFFTRFLNVYCPGVSQIATVMSFPLMFSVYFTSDGWMNTGDLGVIDADGNIFIRGRSKNMILSSNGQNIYPEEIEAVVNSFPYVQETVVVDRNARLVALVYLDAEKLRADGISEDMIPARMDEMMAEVNRSLPSYSKIAKVETRTEPFEKTPKMSIKRFLYS